MNPGNQEQTHLICIKYGFCLCGKTRDENVYNNSIEGKLEKIYLKLRDIEKLLKDKE